MKAQTRAESTQQALSKIEAGIEAVRNSQKFREYLAFCGRFHNYSFGNQILIWSQRPDARKVAGFQTWRSMGRYVRKGEKGIMILAPIAVKRREEVDGELESSDEKVIVSFKSAYVFDVSQTEGDELPTLPIATLTGSDSGLWERLGEVADAEGVHISREERAGEMANGCYVRSERHIWVRPDLGPLQAVKTLAHELSHHFARHDEKKHNRHEAEMVAESSAFVVMAHFGQDSGDYSFGYLASWGDTKILRERLHEIHETVEALMSGLESLSGKAH